MDRVIDYKAIIREFFVQYEQFLTTPPSELPVMMALDDERGQYILFKAGWQGKEYCRYFSLHVTLRDNKIWIEEDMTEDGITTYLLSKGIPHQDIILAFHHPSLRPLTEFAVA